MKNYFVRRLDKLDKKEILLAGGKGAHLAKLLQNGVAVPSGFVILGTAFDSFLKASGIDLDVKKTLKKINFENISSVEKNSAVLKKLVLTMEVSKKLRNEILAAFTELAVKYVAVRSSATTEDSRTASWAGELETYLNTTKETLLENIKKCWASLYTTRALFYRFKKDLLEKSISVAVVVQEMIQSEVSGVCFTAHPVNGNKNLIIIEAVWGLGETIVLGQEPSDSYTLQKETLKILDRKMGYQKKMIVMKNDSNKTVSVPTNKAGKEKLSVEQTKELARLCIKIEKDFVKPQDIEWAFQNNKFYILQTRPITAL